MTPGRMHPLLRPAAIAAIALSAVSCNRDHSITRGASGSEWDRRLRSAVPIGASVATAQATLEHNGFTCRRDAVGVQALHCDKQSGRRFGFFRRRWQAVVSVRDGRVSGVQGTTSFGHRA